MNQTPKNHARKARLPLAVIAAGSLALGGITGGTMLAAPRHGGPNSGSQRSFASS
ncbi:hypothetical protein ACTXJX_16800 [Glutamicibacter ardleyensis]|uniref:hypothetical protein n=1 Tax=Glutamicibacter ardleyensis TaxID=225894 RepID=UPI003FD5FE0C